MDLVADPLLASYFEWDARRLYKYDGLKYVRFMHEPWTANRFWDVQVCVFENLTSMGLRLIEANCNCSQSYLLEGNHLATSSMQTKPSFHHLELKWDILYMHD